MREAIAALPAHFQSETSISGILTPDLHTLGAVLGAAIEEQTVATLNAMRSVWDPEGEYALYSFVRQAQTFPDVLLRRPATAEDEADDIIMGIELKGWYLLSKEGMPNFRLQVTPAACNVQDLVVVVPWALSQVISGRPQVFTPYVESARYAAEFRNYWWQYIRDTDTDRTIHSPANVRPYPNKADAISDVPASDPGGNFGRLARTGMMNAYIAEMLERPLSGIRIEHWLAFLRAVQDTRSREQIRTALDRLATRLRAEVADREEEQQEAVQDLIAALERIAFPG